MRDFTILTIVLRRHRYRSVVCPRLSGYVCLRVTLVHLAKAVGWNEMPFGRDTRVVPDYIVLDRSPGSPMGRGDLGVGTPSLQRCRISPDYFGLCFCSAKTGTQQISFVVPAIPGYATAIRVLCQ